MEPHRSVVHGGGGLLGRHSVLGASARQGPPSTGRGKRCCLSGSWKGAGTAGGPSEWLYQERVNSPSHEDSIALYSSCRKNSDLEQQREGGGGTNTPEWTPHQLRCGSFSSLYVYYWKCWLRAALWRSPSTFHVYFWPKNRWVVTYTQLTSATLDN